MLGIRTASKEDFKCSATEMVFGSTLIVPGEFVSPPQRQHDSLITKFVPKTTDFHGNSKCSPIKALDTADFVFVQVERHKTPLCRPYEGPFRVIGKGVKTFNIMKQNKEEVISIDGLKPAYLHNHIKLSPSQSTPSPAVAPSSSSPPSPSLAPSSFSLPPSPSQISSSPPPTHIPASTNALYTTRYGRIVKPTHCSSGGRGEGSCVVD